jgi:hypothetical protein
MFRESVLKRSRPNRPIPPGPGRYSPCESGNRRIGVVMTPLSIQVGLGVVVDPGAVIGAVLADTWRPISDVRASGRRIPRAH